MCINSAGLHGLPRRSGKLKDISKFDASFFGVHPKQADGMDPQLRLLLEVTYEAIVDAGKPKDKFFFPNDDLLIQFVEFVLCICFMHIL